MKLKKLYMSVICYLTLAAFIGIVSIGVSYSQIRYQKTEVSANKSLMNTGLSFVFEEETDAVGFMCDDLLPGIVLFSVTLVMFRFSGDTPVSLAFYTKYHVPLKTPLCIRLRTLRI